MYRSDDWIPSKPVFSIVNKYSKEGGHGVQMFWEKGGGEVLSFVSQLINKLSILKHFWGVKYINKGPSKASVVFSCSCSHQYVFAIFNTCQSDIIFTP